MCLLLGLSRIPCRLYNEKNVRSEGLEKGGSRLAI